MYERGKNSTQRSRKTRCVCTVFQYDWSSLIHSYIYSLIRSVIHSFIHAFHSSAHFIHNKCISPAPLPSHKHYTSYNKFSGYFCLSILYVLHCIGRRVCVFYSKNAIALCMPVICFTVCHARNFVMSEWKTLFFFSVFVRRKFEGAIWFFVAILLTVFYYFSTSFKNKAEKNNNVTSLNWLNRRVVIDSKTNIID